MFNYIPFLIVTFFVPLAKAEPSKQLFCEKFLGGTHYVEDRHDRCALSFHGDGWDVPLDEVIQDAKVHVKDMIQNNYDPLKKR